MKTHFTSTQISAIKNIVSPMFDVRTTPFGNIVIVNKHREKMWNRARQKQNYRDCTKNMSLDRRWLITYEPERDQYVVRIGYAYDYEQKRYGRIFSHTNKETGLTEYGIKNFDILLGKFAAYFAKNGYAKKTPISNKDFACSVTKFFFFANNYKNKPITYHSAFRGEVTDYLPEFFLGFHRCDVDHLNGKYNYFYEKMKHRSGAALIEFYAELDGDNRALLCKYINEHYDQREDFGINISMAQ